MLGIISLWLRITGSFTAIFIWGSCKCLGLLGGTVLWTVTKVTEPSPRCFVIPKGLPHPKTETALLASEAFLRMKSKSCSTVVTRCFSLLDWQWLWGAWCCTLWPSPSGALSSTCGSRALLNDLPLTVVQAQACQNLADRGSPVTLKQTFQFILSGALVCPLSYLQHSASERQSSGLALESWVMASAERINIVVVGVLFLMLGFF